MKAKYILHIPTGLYYDYAYWPKLDKICCVCFLNFLPPRHRINDTDIFKLLKKQTVIKLHETGKSLVDMYEASINEFELVELEVIT